MISVVFDKSDYGKTITIIKPTSCHAEKKSSPLAFADQVIAADNQRCRACGISDPDASSLILCQSQRVVPPIQQTCKPFACNNRKQHRCRRLAVLPPVEGFGDYNDVIAALSFWNCLQQHVSKNWSQCGQRQNGDWLESVGLQSTID